MTSQPTSAQFEEIVGYYDQPDTPRHLTYASYKTLNELKEEGYVQAVKTDDWRTKYALTGKGRSVLDDYRKRVENRDLKHMKVWERSHMIDNLLNRKDPEDRKLLLHLIDTDRSDAIRMQALELLNLKDDKNALTHDEWNHLATNRSADIRRQAAKHADIERFRDETDWQVVSSIIARRAGEGIPRDIILGWYRRGITCSIDAMTENDIDMVLDDANPEMVGRLTHYMGRKFTPEQVRRVEQLHESDERAYRVAFNSLLHTGENLDDDFLNAHKDDSAMWVRLKEYRDTYRKLKDMERMFADKNGSFIQEQQRLAIQEGQN